MNDNNRKIAKKYIRWRDVDPEDASILRTMQRRGYIHISFRPHIDYSINTIRFVDRAQISEHGVNHYKLGLYHTFHFIAKPIEEAIQWSLNKLS